MDPIERTRQKCAALEALGLSNSASPDTIRATWRRIAFETHPDRPDGSLTDFLAAKAAYDVLTGGERQPKPAKPKKPARPAPGRPTMPRRPRVAARITEITEKTIAECRALLAEAVSPSATDHLPGAMQREGRCLIFLVGTPMARGANRLAVPTGVLEDRRKANPRILTFQSLDGGPANITLSDTLRDEHFPGARSVEIRFGAKVSTGPKETV